MEKLALCRMCLAKNVPMRLVVKKSLQEMFIQLTTVPFVTDDCRPAVACVMCYAKLQNCYEFKDNCLQSEELLQQVLNSDVSTPVTLEQLPSTKRFSKSPIVQTNYKGVQSDNTEDSYDNYIIVRETIIKAEPNDDLPEIVSSHSDPGTSRTNTIAEPQKSHFKEKQKDKQNKKKEQAPKELSRRKTHEDSTCHDKIVGKAVKGSRASSQTSHKQPKEIFAIPGKPKTPKRLSGSKTHEDSTCREKNESAVGEAVKRSRATSETSHKQPKEIFAKPGKEHAPNRLSGSKTHEDSTCREKNESAVGEAVKRSRATSETSHKQPKEIFAKPGKKHAPHRLSGSKTHEDSTCREKNESAVGEAVKRSRGTSETSHRQLKEIGNKKFECDFCKKIFIIKSRLISHLRVHTRDKPYKCNVCYKVFGHKNSLVDHSRKHTGEKPYKCDVCSKCFPLRSGLVVHSRIHNDDKPFKCNICKKFFTDNGNLLKHKRLHTGEKPYECEFCFKTFRQNSHLLSHYRIHTGEKPYKCNLCRKTFSVQSSLDVHIRKHNDDKPYKCNMCNKLFTDSASLVVHKRIHTGEKPYKCQFCPKTFRQNGHLIMHKRIHTGDKPYQCNTCGKCFNQKTNLVGHVRGKKCH